MIRHPFLHAQYEYNPQGSPTRSTQAPGTGNLNLSTTRQYDTLNRVQAVIDAQTGITTLNRDGQDRLIKVTDPRNLATQYSRNGLGDMTQLSSPDRHSEPNV
jgi:YD repeat-containing protein